MNTNNNEENFNDRFNELAKKLKNDHEDLHRGIAVEADQVVRHSGETVEPFNLFLVSFLLFFIL